MLFRSSKYDIITTKQKVQENGISSHFHGRIREILGEDMDQEINRMQPLIREYNKEINRLTRKTEESGIAKEMSERVLSQCVNVSKSIDRLEEETSELVHQKELQDARAEAEQKLENLLLQQSEKIGEIQDDINSRMELINRVVTEKQETAPLLYVSPQKDIIFETPGNTSEGTAILRLSDGNELFGRSWSKYKSND